MTADGLQEKPRPFSRLLESVERARAAREGSSADKANKITNRGRSGSKSSLGGDSLDSRRSHGSPERRKSILKHRDPETEQLLPDLTFEPPPPPAGDHDKLGRPSLKGIGPRAGGKPHALPVKFVGVDEEEDSNRPRRTLPRSPMPRRHPQRAPLADLLADFAGQEKAARDEATPENILKDSLEPKLAATLDQRNANLVLRCSKAPCLYNQPASTSPMATSPDEVGEPRLCLWGAHDARGGARARHLRALQCPPERPPSHRELPHDGRPQQRPGHAARHRRPVVRGPHAHRGDAPPGPLALHPSQRLRPQHLAVASPSWKDAPAFQREGWKETRDEVED
ncbi:hypothetical protein C7M84_000213 [Penaeus vannamei]|uniref:Uncharacterized protein n=1 Tax=Penaeus vannamei TaxID=6689 RepID=A0A3R7PVG7_PENVA|nr:hypothetical protein C7M84_000213 [Penaeus vannamei]